MALRMKNSFSSSIWSAYRENRSKSPAPRRSGRSRASMADRRSQKSSAQAQRSSVAVSSGQRSVSPPMTCSARPSTSAQVARGSEHLLDEDGVAGPQQARLGVEQLDGRHAGLEHRPSPQRPGDSDQLSAGEAGPGPAPRPDHGAGRGHRGAGELQVALQVGLLAGRAGRRAQSAQVALDGRGLRQSRHRRSPGSSRSPVASVTRLPGLADVEDGDDPVADRVGALVGLDGAVGLRGG